MWAPNFLCGHTLYIRIIYSTHTQHIAHTTHISHEQYHKQFCMVLYVHQFFCVGTHFILTIHTHYTPHIHKICMILYELQIFCVTYKNNIHIIHTQHTTHTIYTYHTAHKGHILYDFAWPPNIVMNISCK